MAKHPLRNRFQQRSHAFTACGALVFAASGWPTVVACLVLFVASPVHAEARFSARVRSTLMISGFFPDFSIVLAETAGWGESQLDPGTTFVSNGESFAIQLLKILDVEASGSGTAIAPVAGEQVNGFGISIRAAAFSLVNNTPDTVIVGLDLHLDSCFLEAVVDNSSAEFARTRFEIALTGC